MEKAKKIAALVAAILLPLFTAAGTVITEIELCKHNLWFAAIVFVVLFAFAAKPVIDITVKLLEYALKNEG